LDKVLVVGSGLVGSVVSAFMADLGHDVEVCDRHPDPRGARAAGGRSINLTICDRGFAALERIGAADAVRAIAVPCRGRIIHNADGRTATQPYDNHGSAIWSVSRNELNAVLIDRTLSRSNVVARFDERCLEVDLDAPAATFERADGEVVRRTGDRLLGADGARSMVRLRMQMSPRFDYNQEYLDQGYRELRLPAAARGKWRIEGHAIHVWPRGRYMLIGFPNRDGSFTLSLHLPFEGETSFASIRTRDDLVALFETSFPDALPLVPTLVEDFFARAETTMVTIRCAPWIWGDKVALVGDSAHAIVPSYGQGANCGFEDCAVLADCVGASKGDWRRAFSEYQRLRKPNADAIADLALDHFHELRDLLGSPEFLLRKEIERWLEEAHPDRYRSLYSLISFSQVPYVEALRLDKKQRGLVDRLLGIPQVRQRLGGTEVSSLVTTHLDVLTGEEIYAAY
jgi:kynurenine 3-monooxygenase